MNQHVILIPNSFNNSEALGVTFHGGYKLLDSDIFDDYKSRFTSAISAGPSGRFAFCFLHTERITNLRVFPILLMTGYTSTYIPKKLPVDDSIEKPFDLPLFESKIENILDNNVGA